jgi:hypothetical protein
MRQLVLDGVALSHEEAGEGEPPVLLVHGWCCDHTYFAPQFEHFVKKGRRVVAVAAGGLAVPGLYVAADELQPRSDKSRFHKMFPQILYGKTVGSEHFCQLQVPEHVNAMIERFLAITL